MQFHSTLLSTDDVLLNAVKPQRLVFKRQHLFKSTELSIVSPGQVLIHPLNKQLPQRSLPATACLLVLIIFWPKELQAAVDTISIQ